MRLPLALFFVLASFAPAQKKDISLETLGRALEGRLGVYARNVATGEQIAINADKPYPAAGIEAAFLPPGSESRPSERSPRSIGEQIERLHQSWQRGLDHPIRRTLVTTANRTLIGPGLSPTVEVGAATGGTPRSPGIAGWASAGAGDIVFCVLTSGLESSFTASCVFPEIVEACFRKLVPGFAEVPEAPKPEGLLIATLHERDQDSKLFPKPPDARVAEGRPGVQRFKFHPGDVARVAVLHRPRTPSRVTVQWWSPDDRAESASSQVLDGTTLAEAVFDLPLEKLGCWRVRAAVGDVIVYDEKFYVTAK